VSTYSLRVPSPDGRKAIELEYQDEVRFGPAYFRGSAVGFTWPLGAVPVGEEVHWSADSRYAIVFVFLSLDASKPPAVKLVAIDTQSGRAIDVDQNPAGWLYQVGFAPDGSYRYKYGTPDPANERSWMPPP
jgi:hypothetical protein